MLAWSVYECYAYTYDFTAQKFVDTGSTKPESWSRDIAISDQ